MPVDLFGHPADLDPIRELAEKHGLAMVEDALSIPRCKV